MIWTEQADAENCRKRTCEEKTALQLARIHAARLKTVKPLSNLPLKSRRVKSAWPCEFRASKWNLCSAPEEAWLLEPDEASKNGISYWPSPLSWDGEKRENCDFWSNILLNIQNENSKSGLKSQRVKILIRHDPTIVWDTSHSRESDWRWSW